MRKLLESDFIEYGETRMDYKLNVTDEQIEKMITALNVFGYVYHESFSTRSYKLNNGRGNFNVPDTSHYYRKLLNDGCYIEIQIGRDKVGRGIFRYSGITTPDLNPDTNQTWKIGDTRYTNGGRIAILTRYGWNTGD